MHYPEWSAPSPSPRTHQLPVNEASGDDAFTYWFVKKFPQVKEVPIEHLTTINDRYVDAVTER